jgi:hypothetical protein
MLKMWRIQKKSLQPHAGMNACSQNQDMWCTKSFRDETMIKRFEYDNYFYSTTFYSYLFYN